MHLIIARRLGRTRLGSFGFVAVLTLLHGCSGTDPALSLGADGDSAAGAMPGSDAATSPGHVASTSVTPDGGGPIASPEAGSSFTPTKLGECGAVSQMATNKLQPVDIILGIDTTGSMAEEIGFTEQNMNAFSQQISAAGIDVRVILIATAKGAEFPFVEAGGVCIAAPLGSGTCPNDSNPPRYVHLPKGLADWDMLQAYIDQYPMYKQYLRNDSFKAIVSISDGDIAGNPALQQPINSADKFIDALKALEPGATMWKDWRYSAIYTVTGCSGIGNQAGVTHSDLVKRTNGVAGDLCQQNFKPVFDSLAKQVTEVVRLSCDWDIPAQTGGKAFDPLLTNVQLTLDGKVEAIGQAKTRAECGLREGWHYDEPSNPKRVVACPATCTRLQEVLSAKVDLLFGCQTIPLL